MNEAAIERACERLKKAQEQLGQHPWRKSAQDECRLAREHLQRVQREAQAQGQQPVLFEEGT